MSNSLKQLEEYVNVNKVLEEKSLPEKTSRMELKFQSNFHIINTDEGFWSVPRHQQLDASRRSLTLSGGAEERQLRRMSNTPQGGAIEGNTAP
jgi:hypothetical protein